MKTQITVRGVHENVFREFKAFAVLNGMTVGQALTLAMIKFMENSKNKKLTLKLQFKPKTL